MTIFEQATQALEEFINNPDREKMTIVLDKDYQQSGGPMSELYPVNPTVTITYNCINNVE